MEEVDTRRTSKRPARQEEWLGIVASDPRIRDREPWENYCTTQQGIGFPDKGPMPDEGK
jgi:hypothetical protein